MPHARIKRWLKDRPFTLNLWHTSGYITLVIVWQPRVGRA